MSEDELAMMVTDHTNTPPAQLMVWQRDQFDSMKSNLAAGETMKIGDKPYIKRNGWRMIAAGFNVDLELVKDNDGKVLHNRMEGEDDVGRYYVHTYVARATLPSGKFAECEGACSSRDSFFGKAHGAWKPMSEIDEADIIATAQTVAYNRAISDLVGGAEVSAEEMRGKESVLSPTDNKSQGAGQQDARTISEAQSRLVGFWFGISNLEKERRDALKNHYGITDLKELTRSQMDDIKKTLISEGSMVEVEGKFFAPDEVPVDENSIAQDHPEMIEGEVQ